MHSYRGNGRCAGEIVTRVRKNNCFSLCQITGAWGMKWCFICKYCVWIDFIHYPCWFM